MDLMQHLNILYEIVIIISYCAISVYFVLFVTYSKPKFHFDWISDPCNVLYHDHMYARNPRQHILTNFCKLSLRRKTMAILFERKYFTHLQLDTKTSEKDSAIFRDALLSICTVSWTANVKTVAATKKLTLKLAKLAYLDAINNCDTRFVSAVKRTRRKKGMPDFKYAFGKCWQKFTLEMYLPASVKIIHKCNSVVMQMSCLFSEIIWPIYKLVRFDSR
jgi:hypothetical protein